MHRLASPETNRVIRRVMVFAAKKLPEMSYVRHRFCPLCDMEHRLHKRQFAHTYCNDPKLTPEEKKLVKARRLVCWARAMTSLSAARVAGVCLHELGHLIAGPMDNYDRFAQEMGADVAVLTEFDVEIKYVTKHNNNIIDLRQLER